MYNNKLRESAQKYKNIVCLGLDPVVELLPSDYSTKGADGIALFFESLFIAMKENNVVPTAFKPNQGYYLIYDKPFDNDFSGSLALVQTIKLIRTYFPDIPVIMDYKRGDIAKSSHNYAVEGFDVWTCDAVTISPYMGQDSVEPFLKYSSQGKGTYILNRTSNPGAADFQSEVYDQNITLFKKVAEKIKIWAERYPGTGAVVGATSPDELAILAEIYSKVEVPLLIPGVGSQGGSATETCKRLASAGYDLHLARINSSSGITQPWAKRGEKAGQDWQKDSLTALKKLIDETAEFI